MKQSDNIHRLFDGELSEEETKILEEAMSADPSLAGELNSIKTFADLHRKSFPETKDEVFIEREFLEIQKRINAPSETQKVTRPSFQSRDKSKLDFFSSSNWLRGAVALAAAVALTVTGAWFFHQENAQKSFMNDPKVAFVETDIDGASSMIFMDEQSGWTFVWVDEPTKTAEVAG